MKSKNYIPLIFFLFVSSCSTNRSNKKTEIVEQRPPVRCMENSPERRGEEGCTILTNRLLVMSLLSNTVYWHIDRFDSLQMAMTAAGPNSVAAEAHGSFWLMTVGPKSEDNCSGHHVALIGPLVLTVGKSYSMRVQSSLIKPGATTPAHTHPGPEVIYVVAGEQCLETPEIGVRLSAGQFYVVPDGVIHRGRPMGTNARRAFGLNLYDATHPTSHDLDNPPTLASCK